MECSKTNQSNAWVSIIIIQYKNVYKIKEDSLRLNLANKS